MLVKNWMSTKVHTVDVEASMHEAMKKLKDHGIAMLPVTKKGKLAGVVTDRDLKQASASDATTLDVHELLYLISKIKVKDIMTRDPVTIPDDATVEEAAEVLLEKRISGLPVLGNRGELSGIITKNDIFRVLISLTGVGRRGIQFAFLMEDRPGSIKEVADIIRDYGGRMVSILSSYEDAAQGYRKVYIRMYDITRTKLPALKADLRKAAKILYMVDHRENKREIY